MESTYLRLAFICHFSIVQGVLLLRQMSKTRFEKKAMKSLAVAELLMMLSSGRMISLCLKKEADKGQHICLGNLLFHVLICVIDCKARKKKFGMSQMKRHAHHLRWSKMLLDTDSTPETHLTLDSVVVNIPHENELDIMVKLTLLLHLVKQPLVIIRPHNRLVNQVLRGLQRAPT